MTRVVAMAALIALAVLLGAWRSRAELRRWLGHDPLAVRRAARALLLATSAGLLAWAWTLAAQQPPRFSDGGLDVVMAIDVSRSMDVRDTPPTRLKRALRFAERLVLEAEGARLGLVIFAGAAYVALPLTLDRDAHLSYLHALDSDVLSNKGSDLAQALRTSARVFDPRSPRPRVLVLLSDGEHAGSGLDDTLIELRGAGVRVIAVGFGRSAGAVVPGPRGGPMFDRQGRPIVSRRADPVLERIVSVTGGAFYREFEDAPRAAALLPAVKGMAREAAPRGGLLSLLVAAALALLVAELWIWAGPLHGWGELLWRWPRLARGGTAALAALTLLACPQTDLQQADARLAEDAPAEALSLYRRLERRMGREPETQIRIGNALYRLGEHDRSAAAYLEALRHLQLEDGDERFVASFNLGDTLLTRERYVEARDQFWTALLERPDSLEAKFNYEWAGERASELPPAPAPQVQSPTPAPGAGGDEGAGEASDESGGEPALNSSLARQTTQLRPPQAAPQLTEREAERWLESIEDSMEGPLRRQVNQSLGPGRRRLGGQTW